MKFVAVDSDLSLCSAHIVFSSFLLVDNPKIEERPLTIAAFEYITTSTEKPGKEDYDELAIVTAEVVDEMYESFFDNLPDIDYGFIELHRYIAVTPRLVEFKISSFFHRPSLVPSLAQAEDVASRGFGTGAEFYDLYLARLQGMTSKVFSSTTSFRFINSQQGLKATQEETDSDRQDSWWGENIIKVVVPVAASFVAFFLCMFCVCHYRQNRRPLTIEEQLTVLEAKVGDRGRGNSSVSSSSTYASDYRTSVFSECTFEKEATADTNLPMSDIRELSLDEELENVMSQLEEGALDSPEDATAGDSWQSVELLVTGLAPPAEPREKVAGGKHFQLLPVVDEISTKAEATSYQPKVSSQTPRDLPPPANDDATKDETVVIKSVAALQRQEQPEWMSKKLKAVAKPPAFLELTTAVDTPSAPEEVPAATKGAPSTAETIAPIKVVAAGERVACRPPVSPEEKGKPIWMTRKLQPVGKTPALPVLSTKADAIASQPETTSNETKDPLASIALAAKNKRDVQQSVTSLDEGRKPAWMTKKTPALPVLSTKTDAITSQPETTSNETIALAAKDKRVVQQSVASLDEGRKPAWTTKKLKPVAKTPVATADTTETEATTFQSEAISTETKDSPTPIVLATNDESAVQLLVASSDEERKPAGVTRKPNPVAKVPVTTVASQPVASPIEVPISTGISTKDENIAHQPKEASAEASIEASAEASIEASAEASIEASAETSTGASIEASAETCIEASTEASTGASTVPTEASTDESTTTSTGESTDALTEIPTKEDDEVSTAAPTRKESVVVSKPFVSLVEEQKPGGMMKTATFPELQFKPMQTVGMNIVEASLVEEGQPAWMEGKPVAQVPELKAAQDSGAEKMVETSLVEEGQPGWLKKKPTIPVPELKASQEAEANGTVEASPAVPDWMQKFREIGL
jgi:hypothetical protein